MNKQAIRDRIWDELDECGEARFPYPPHDRIPNFAGADSAAERLASTPEWQSADVIKSNPDSPQLPVRRMALSQGKTVFVAVPRLRENACFLRLNPGDIADTDEAATIGGTEKFGEPRRPSELPPIDLIVAGSVAVSKHGDRIGKGEGYSDLEYAILRESGAIDANTPIATTVHERQLLSEAFDTAPHDVLLDFIVTPERVLHPTHHREQPSGIDWTLLDEARCEDIPILRELAPSE